MKKFNAFLLLLSLSISLSAVADLPQAKNEFNGEELRQIRGVSQTILKTRGQDRQRILEETKGLREDIAQIKQALRISPEFHGATDLRGGAEPSIQTISLTLSSDEHNGSGVQRFVSGIKRALKGGASSNTQKRPPHEFKEKQINAHLEKAQKIVAKRKSEAEKNDPAFWEFWEERSDVDASTIQLMEKLELRIEKIRKAKGEEKQAMFESMKQQFRKETSEKPAEPTISTITKHVRK